MLDVLQVVQVLHLLFSILFEGQDLRWCPIKFFTRSALELLVKVALSLLCVKLIHPAESKESLLQEEPTHECYVSLSMKTLQMRLLGFEAQRLGNEDGKLFDLPTQELDPPQSQLGI